MSFTAAQQVFGSIHESALNDMIRAFLTARPRYLRYGSAAFVPATTVNATHMDAIPFPGIVGGIDWAVGFEIPIIDLFKQNQTLPSQLTLGPGQFSLSTKVQICLNCAGENPVIVIGRDQPGSFIPIKARSAHPVCALLEVFGLGHIDSWHDSNGNGGVKFRVDAIELVDITPDTLETLLECLIKMVLDAALSNVELPLQALRAGAFQLVVVQGPEIDDDQIKVFGNL